MKNIQIKVTVEISHKVKGTYGDNTVELVRNVRDHSLPVGTIKDLKSEANEIISSVAQATRDTLNRVPAEVEEPKDDND